jgi:hypothetical protein
MVTPKESGAIQSTISKGDLEIWLKIAQEAFQAYLLYY